MAARAYLAELLGTFLFLTIGYLSVAGVRCGQRADAEPARRAVLVRPRPAGRDLRGRPHLGRPLQSGRDRSPWSLDKRTPPMDARRLHHRPDHRCDRAPAVVVLLTVSQAAVAAGVTKPGRRRHATSARSILEIIAHGRSSCWSSWRRPSARPPLAALAIPLTLVAIHFATAPADAVRRSTRPARSARRWSVATSTSCGSTSSARSSAASSAGRVWRVVDGGDEDDAGQSLGEVGRHRLTRP